MELMAGKNIQAGKPGLPQYGLFSILPLGGGGYQLQLRRHNKLTEELIRHNEQMSQLIVIKMSKCRSGLVGEIKRGVNMGQVVFGMKGFLHPC